MSQMYCNASVPLVSPSFRLFPEGLLVKSLESALTASQLFDVLNSSFLCERVPSGTFL